MHCRKKIAKPPSVEILEMLATRRAVQFTIELSFVHSVFEVDSEIGRASCRERVCAIV